MSASDANRWTRIALEVAVRHRMPDEDDVEARVAQDPADAAAGLALPAARPDGADGDDRLRALEHRPLRAEQPEVRAGGEHRRGLVHHLGVREIRVREHDLVDALRADQGGELLLGVDRDPVRVERPGERRRVAAVGDARDLRGGEGDDAASRGRRGRRR